MHGSDSGATVYVQRGCETCSLDGMGIVGLFAIWLKIVRKQFGFLDY